MVYFKDKYNIYDYVFEFQVSKLKKLIQKFLFIIYLSFRLNVFVKQNEYTKKNQINQFNIAPIIIQFFSPK